MTPRGCTQLLGRNTLSLLAPGAALRKVSVTAHLGPAQPARSIVLPPLQGASKAVIRARLARLTVFFLVDDSGSMYGTWGDPNGVRYAAARSLLELLRRSGGARVSIIHWGTDAPADMALAPIKLPRGRKDLELALSIPPTLGGTNVLSALGRAAELTPPLVEDEQAIYFILGDGIELVTPAINTALSALGERQVHMLLVDRSGGCDPALEAAWRSVPFGSFTRLRTFDTRAMAHQLAQIAAATLSLEISQPPAETRKTR